MSFDDLPIGLTEIRRRAVDMRMAECTIEEDVYDFRQFAEAMLRGAPGFIGDADMYAVLCDLAGNHPIYLSDYIDAQEAMDQWNDVRAVAHDALPRLEAAIREDQA